MQDIYLPAEDSFLMSRILKEKVPSLLEQKPNLKFLEIGCGSGIHLETAKEIGVKIENIFSSDINPKAVSHCKKLGFNSIKSDLFENIKDVWHPAEAKKRCYPSVLRGRSARKIKGFPRFEKIKGKYNLIIFNPPYLPEDKREPEDSKLATTGGKNGSEIILRFLKQAKKYLRKDGKIFLITSSLSGDISFENLGYIAKEIGCEKLFFERLCIWEINL